MGGDRLEGWFVLYLLFFCFMLFEIFGLNFWIKFLLVWVGIGWVCEILCKMIVGKVGGCCFDERFGGVLILWERNVLLLCVCFWEGEIGGGIFKFFLVVGIIGEYGGDFIVWLKFWEVLGCNFGLSWLCICEYWIELFLLLYLILFLGLVFFLLLVLDLVCFFLCLDFLNCLVGLLLNFDLVLLLL